jgi:hypothetical protein
VIESARILEQETEESRSVKKDCGPITRPRYSSQAATKYEISAATKTTVAPRSISQDTQSRMGICDRLRDHGNALWALYPETERSD